MLSIIFYQRLNHFSPNRIHVDDGLDKNIQGSRSKKILTKREITYRAENFVMKKKFLFGYICPCTPITAGYGVSKSMNDNANADLPVGIE